MNKKQLTKIRESIIKLGEHLGTRQTRFILYGFCALLIVFILIFAFKPLAIKLQDADRELKSLMVQLLNQRRDIGALKYLSLKGKLIQQKHLSLAINKITGKGRALGLKFISITPKESRKLAPGFAVLPITFQIECTYKSLGKSLAYFEELPYSIAEVKSLIIRPREKDLPKLNAEVLVYLYMEGKDAK